MGAIHMKDTGFSFCLEQALDAFKLMKDPEFINAVKNAESILTEVVSLKKQILICGNGGSAADALHIAGELTGRFTEEREAIRAIALPADIASMTAIANDYSYERVFARLVEAHGENGGLLIAISTSGMSRNVVAAAESAKALGMAVIGMTGHHGGILNSKSTVCIKIPSSSTPMIQQGHQLVYHYLCGLAEKVLVENSGADMRTAHPNNIRCD